MRISIILAPLVLAPSFTGTAAQAAFYVDCNAPGPEHDGTSWDTAFLTIQEGADAATPGAEVWVADGVYVENVVMGEGLAIYGGFLGAEPGGYETERDQRDFVNNVTMIDGNQAGNCVVMAAAARVDGFTITNGSGTTTGEYARGGGVSCEDVGDDCVIANNTIAANSTDYGGGVYCWNSSPIITDNTIADNAVRRLGGGLYCHHSSPITACNVIVGNSAERAGGGICCVSDSAPVIQESTITGNSAYLGGGICSLYGSSPTVIRNTISGNSATDGGGISCSDASAAIAGNSISGNRAKGWGGGISCSESSPIIVGNAVFRNDCDQWGGGVFCFDASPTIVSNLVVGNASFWGGGIYCIYQCSPILANNTICDSGATESGGGITCSYHCSPIVANNIVTGSFVEDEVGGGVYCDETSSPFLSHNDVWHNSPGDYAGCEPGEGDISADPLFVDPENGDFHLHPESPCIDAGCNDYVFGDEDVDGDPRVIYAGRFPVPHWAHPGIVDIGADEFVPPGRLRRGP